MYSVDGKSPNQKIFNPRSCDWCWVSFVVRSLVTLNQYDFSISQYWISCLVKKFSETNLFRKLPFSVLWDKFASRQFVKDDGVSSGEIFWDSKCDLGPTETRWTWKVTRILNSLSISDARVLLPFVQMDNFLFALRRGHHEGKKMWNSHQCCETLEGTLTWCEILASFSKPVRSRIILPLTFLRP